MTLILTVGNSRGVFQSSDYRLTDQRAWRPLLPGQAGVKQLDASVKGLRVTLAFTGVAAVGAQRTIDHLSEALKAIPNESDLWKICGSLKTKSEKWCGSRGPLTLVLTVGSIGTVNQGGSK